MILVLGKARGHRVPSLGCRDAMSPGGFYVFQKNSAWDMIHEWTYYHDKAANHQLPIDTASWTIRIVSTEECSSLTQYLMHIHCCPCSVILNVMATQYICSLDSVYCPHWLVQWSHHWSRMHIPVHSPCLPGYIHVTQTILVKLTMAGLFLDRPHIYTNWILKSHLLFFLSA